MSMCLVSVAALVGPRSGLAAPDRSIESSAGDVVTAYVAAFNKGRFLAALGCFADPYFGKQETRAGDLLSQMEAQYPEDARFRIWVLKSEVVPAEDGQRAKGFFLYQLTGKQPVTNCDRKEVRKLRYRFYRTDFKAARGVNGWRFTTFETAASDEARQIKVDCMLVSLKPFTAEPKKTAGE